MNADTGRAWSSERGSPCGLVEGRGRRSRHREMKCPARRWGEAQVADQPWLRRTKERGSSCVLALRAEHRVSHLCDARDATGSERRKGPFLSVRCRGSVAAPSRWSHPCRAVFVKERGTERRGALPGSRNGAGHAENRGHAGRPGARGHRPLSRGGL